MLHYITTNSIVNVNNNDDTDTKIIITNLSPTIQTPHIQKKAFHSSLAPHQKKVADPAAHNERPVETAITCEQNVRWRPVSYLICINVSPTNLPTCRSLAPKPPSPTSCNRTGTNLAAIDTETSCTSETHAKLWVSGPQHSSRRQEVGHSGYVYFVLNVSEDVTRRK